MAGEQASTSTSLSSPAAAAAAGDPITPGKPQPRPALPDMSMTPQSSPFNPAGLPPSTQRRANNDPLLHRLLDKTYRIAATPHTARRRQQQQQQQQRRRPVGATPQTANRAARWTAAAAAVDSSPVSSPLAAPQLRPEIFSSPVKAPRTPGVSVVTPGAFGRRGGTATGREASGGMFTGGRSAGTRVWDDSDEEEEEGTEASPPKTMTFVVPQSRLLQTPGECALSFLILFFLTFLLQFFSCVCAWGGFVRRGCGRLAD